MSLSESVPALFDMDSVSQIVVDDDGPRIVPSIILNDDSPRVRKSDPLASHEAADSITPGKKLGSQQAVYLWLSDRGPVEPWRAEKAFEGKWSESRVRSALNELLEQGLVKRHDRAGVSKTGHRCDLVEAIRHDAVDVLPMLGVTE